MDKMAILCLDDDDLILEMLEYQLHKRFGDKFLYEFAQDPIEALDILEEINKENRSLFLVITDWMMPEMNGDLFLTIINNNFPEAIKVMLTGKTDKEDLKLGDVNLYGFLYKPWDEEDLHTLVDNAIDRFEDSLYAHKSG